MDKKGTGLGLNRRYMACCMASQPIQLPATVESPLHTASGPAPPTVSGEKTDTSSTASGPPMIIPTVPVMNIRPALRRSFHISLRSRLRVNRRSEEHTSELQSLMRISYAVFCLKKKQNKLKIQ